MLGKGRCYTLKLFIASTLCWAYHPNEVITIAKEKGLDGVEIWADHFFYHQAEPEEVRYHAESEKIKLTVHASSWDLNICSLNKGIQIQSIVEVKKSIKLARALNAIHMTFHPGQLTVKDRLVNEHMETLVTNTRKLVEYAKEKDVALSIEVMEPIEKELITDPETINNLLEQVGEGLYATLDIAHTPLEESNISYFEDIKRVNSIHLSDARKGKYHLPLGEGEIDLVEVLRYFEKTDLPVVLEGMDTEGSLFFLKEHLNYLNKNIGKGNYAIGNSNYK